MTFKALPILTTAVLFLANMKEIAAQHLVEPSRIARQKAVAAGPVRLPERDQRGITPTVFDAYTDGFRETTLHKNLEAGMRSMRLMKSDTVLLDGEREMFVQNTYFNPDTTIANTNTLVEKKFRTRVGNGNLYTNSVTVNFESGARGELVVPAISDGYAGGNYASTLEGFPMDEAKRAAMLETAAKIDNIARHLKENERKIIAVSRAEECVKGSTLILGGGIAEQFIAEKGGTRDVNGALRFVAY